MRSQGLTEEEQSAVNEFTAKLRNRFPNEIRAIKLFGSKARGDSHRESDLDLLVLVEEKTEELENTVIDLVCETLNRSGVYLEVVTLPISRYEKAKEEQYPFIINVERDAVAL